MAIQLYCLVAQQKAQCGLVFGAVVGGWRKSLGGPKISVRQLVTAYV